MAGAHLDVPFAFDVRGRAALSNDEEHIRDLIKTVLFTAPGERVNRPEFGCGVRQLVFAPLSPELAATSQHLIQGALLRWLGDLVLIEAVHIEAIESTMTINVVYSVRATGERQSAIFEQAIAS
jgi:hypothetical protein